MSLSVQLTSLVEKIANEFKIVNSRMSADGSLTELKTDQRSTLVLAINEIHDQVEAALAFDKALINDSAASKDSVFSALKVNAMLEQLRAELMGSEEIVGALDTIKEIAVYAQQNKSLIDGIHSLAKEAVSVKAGVVYTDEQITNVMDNLKLTAVHASFTQRITTVEGSVQELKTFVGDQNADYVKIFEDALKVPLKK